MGCIHEVNFFLTKSNILWTRKDVFDDVLGNFPLTVLCRTAMVYQSEKSCTYIKSVIFIDPSSGSYKKSFLSNVIQPFIDSKPVCIRVVMWSCVSRKTRLKIGLAISRDLKCKTCKTQKLVKLKHFGSFWEENIFFSVNTVIPDLISFFVWQIGWPNWQGIIKRINK